MNGPQFTSFNEGCRLTAYPDSLGFWTIGIGRHVGITEGQTCTQQQADDWFNEQDYPSAQHAASILIGADVWNGLNECRQAALTDMCFQLGPSGLGKFTGMLAAIKTGDWQGAHDECLDSLYAKQVPNRANAVADLFLTGEWP